MIHVQFWNAATDRRIAEQDLTPEELRVWLDSSAVRELAGATWTFHRSEPAEVAGADRVKVWVHEIRSVSPQDVLFSLPTINDWLPDATAPAISPDVLRLREDDWRQLEVVSRRLEAAVESCLREIRHVLVEERRGAGFTRVYARKEVPNPLEGVTLRLADLRDRVLGDHPDSRKFHGVSFEGASGVIAGGFALRTPPGLTLYGLQDRGLVHTLAMVDVPSAWEDPFFRLLRDFDLRMIDWCRAQTLLPPS